jgi:cyclopropane-fatty-acyl-phospholipid synthase
MVSTLGHTAAGLIERHRKLGHRQPVTDFAIQYGDGPVYRIGGGPATFTIIVRDRRGSRALASMDELEVAIAYLNGWLDLTGDMLAALSMRRLFSDRHPIAYVTRFLHPLLRGQVVSDRKFISAHYDQDSDFFLTFMDSRHRCYSHAVFTSEDESLEDAMTRKMDLAIEAVGVRTGDHVLEVGGGWGAFAEHAARQGIKVTTLTISAESERFMTDLFTRQNLPVTVVREHLFDYASGRRFDAIINMGVTEHLPDYTKTLQAYQRLLIPGRRVYLDAVAMRAKYRLSTFMNRYIYPGNASPVVLHDYLAAVSKSPFRLSSIVDDRDNYYRTCVEWARRLDAAYPEIVRRWGEQIYRRFRLYLWGSAAGFDAGTVLAYRWVLELP